MSPICELAFKEIQKYSNVLLKFITPNEVDNSQSNQAGYYIPKKAAHLFTPQKPEKGVNHTHPVEILWQDGSTTQSVVKWYGKGSRSEYRITRYGRDFPFASNRDLVGDLLVLISTGDSKIIAYVFDLEEDIEELLAGLNIELHGSYAIIEKDEESPDPETCVSKLFTEFALTIEQLPSGRIFSKTTLDAIQACVPGFAHSNADIKLSMLLTEEYRLFKLAERKIYSPIVTRNFKSIDEFILQALSILNSRKSRAGRSLENHVQFILENAGIPHEMRTTISGIPDVIIPSKKAYDDPKFPTESLVILALKTTCKDRWRQVLQEGPRQKTKHLITTQEGISAKQLDEMKGAGITLIVPESLHSKYPASHRSQIQTVEEFLFSVQRLVS
jgi:hypothetical protein